MCLKADTFAFSKVSLPEPLTAIVWFGQLPAAAMSDRATEETFPAPDECRGDPPPPEWTKAVDLRQASAAKADRAANGNAYAISCMTLNTLNIGNVLLHWIDSHPGYLAEWTGGLYLVYQSFNIELGKFSWMARFQTKDQRLDFGGFDSLNDAKQSCDHHATHFQALNFFLPVASALRNQGMGLLLAASGNHVAFLTIFRRLLRGDTSK